METVSSVEAAGNKLSGPEEADNSEDCDDLTDDQYDDLNDDQYDDLTEE